LFEKEARVTAVTLDVTPASLLPEPVRALREAIDAVGLFLAAGGDGRVGTMAVLLREQQRLEGLVLRQVAQVDLSGSWVEVAPHGTHVLVQQALGCTVEHARATVRLARRLEQDLAPVGELLRAGRISRAHAAAVVHGLRGLEPEVVEGCLEAVCAAALSADPSTLGRVLRERAEAVSSRLAQEQRRRLEARKELRLDETPDGGWHLSGTLNAEEGALLQEVLDRGMEAGRVEGDTRSKPQRRQQAFMDVVRHHADCREQQLPGQGSNRAQVIIVASADAVVGTAGATPARVSGTRGGLLTRRELMRLMCDADISTVTLSEDLERVDLGRSTRTVTKAQWLALVARDRGCVVKGCHRSPSGCQAHHVIWWCHGGTSDLGNYVLLCHAHHHDLHDRGAWLSTDDGRLLTPDGYRDTAFDPPPRRPSRS
jgi:hypothetical protein